MGLAAIGLNVLTLFYINFIVYDEMQLEKIYLIIAAINSRSVIPFPFFMIREVRHDKIMIVLM